MAHITRKEWSEEGMDRIEKAVRILKGYCNKHTECDGCRFKQGDGVCILQDNIPIDWKKSTSLIED